MYYFFLFFVYIVQNTGHILKRVHNIFVYIYARIEFIKYIYILKNKIQF